jgi:hypothetical protein
MTSPQAERSRAPSVNLFLERMVQTLYRWGGGLIPGLRRRNAKGRHICSAAC